MSKSTKKNLPNKTRNQRENLDLNLKNEESKKAEGVNVLEPLTAEDSIDSVVVEKDFCKNKEFLDVPKELIGDTEVLNNKVEVEDSEVTYETIAKDLNLEGKSSWNYENKIKLKVVDRNDFIAVEVKRGQPLSLLKVECIDEEVLIVPILKNKFLKDLKKGNKKTLLKEYGLDVKVKIAYDYTIEKVKEKRSSVKFTLVEKITVNYENKKKERNKDE